MNPTHLPAPRRGPGLSSGGWVATVVSLTLMGCQLIGGGATGPTASTEAGGEGGSVEAVPAGTFLGFLEIDGGRVEGILTLTPVEGASFDGTFESPPDLVAMGSGRIRDGSIRLDLSYEGACPGRMRLEGRWESASGDLTGSLEARDCTGVASGTFLFRAG